jgi:hypothetical protein
VPQTNRMTRPNANRGVSPASTPVKVLFVEGAGRSGTTLLHRLVGEIDGFLPVGEIKWLWWAYLNTDWQCGCRQLLTECPFWHEVLEHTHGEGPDHAAIRRAMELQNRTARMHNLPRLLAQRGHASSHRWSELAEWTQAMGRLYSSIAEVSGARVLVDCSKNASGAAVLRIVPGVDPYVVHLVRDPRGYVNSMFHPKNMQPHGAEGVSSNFRRPVVSSLVWVRQNVTSGLVRWRFGPRRARLVRYEDLVVRPADVLESIADLMGEPYAGVHFVDEATVVLHESHTSWGNPSRFDVGPVKLRRDERWRTGLSTGGKFVATALPLPLMLRYGYDVRFGAESRSPSNATS